MEKIKLKKCPFCNKDLIEAEISGELLYVCIPCREGFRVKLINTNKVSK